jgi:hypothetical protein
MHLTDGAIAHLNDSEILWIFWERSLGEGVSVCLYDAAQHRHLFRDSDTSLGAHVVTLQYAEGV